MLRSALAQRAFSLAQHRARWLPGFLNFGFRGTPFVKIFLVHFFPFVFDSVVVFAHALPSLHWIVASVGTGRASKRAGVQFVPCAIVAYEFLSALNTEPVRATVSRGKLDLPIVAHADSARVILGTIPEKKFPEPKNQTIDAIRSVVHVVWVMPRIAAKLFVVALHAVATRPIVGIRVGIAPPIPRVVPKTAIATAAYSFHFYLRQTAKLSHCPAK